MLRDRPQDFILCRRIWPGAAGGWVSDIRWTASGVLKAHFQFGPLESQPGNMSGEIQDNLHTAAPMTSTTAMGSSGMP